MLRAARHSLIQPGRTRVVCARLRGRPLMQSAWAPAWPGVSSSTRRYSSKCSVRTTALMEGRVVPSLFISHSSQDQSAAVRVNGWLDAAGFATVFLDFDPERGIPPGRNWERELYAQLRL